MLPAAQGFTRKERRIVNLSYYVWPAIYDFAQAAGDQARWRRLEADGLALLDSAAFGTYRLPPDWLSIGSQDPRIADGWPPYFGFDASEFRSIWHGATSRPVLAGSCLRGRRHNSPESRRHGSTWRTEWSRLSFFGGLRGSAGPDPFVSDGFQTSPPLPPWRTPTTTTRQASSCSPTLPRERRPWRSARNPHKVCLCGPTQTSPILQLEACEYPMTSWEASGSFRASGLGMSAWPESCRPRRCRTSFAASSSATTTTFGKLVERAVSLNFSVRAIRLPGELTRILHGQGFDWLILDLGLGENACLQIVDTLGGRRDPPRTILIGGEDKAVLDSVRKSVSRPSWNLLAF